MVRRNTKPRCATSAVDVTSAGGSPQAVLEGEGGRPTSPADP